MPNTPLNKEELRDSIKNIARFKFGPFKDTVPAKIILMPSDSDPRGGNGGMQYSYDAFIDDVMELYIADRNAAVREARIEEMGLTLDRVLGDSWTHPNPGSEEEYFKVHVEHVVHYLNARRSALQSQPNAKEDSDE